MTNQNDIELRWIINVILHRLWVVIGCALLVAIIATVIAYSMPLTYSASVKLVVEPSTNTQSNEYDTLAAAERLAYTYSQMVKNMTVVETTIKALGLSVTPEALIKQITVQPIEDTHMILLSVVDSSPEKASTLVNTLADAFIQYNREMQTQKYSGSLADNQKKIDDFHSLIQESQSQIDLLTTQRSNEEIKLAELKDSQTEYKADYRLLQKDQEDLLLRLQQLENHITVAEVALPSQNVGAYAAGYVTVTLLVNQNPVIEGNDYSAILAGESLASTYSQVVGSRPIVEKALAKIGSKQKYEDLIPKISVKTIPNTMLIKLSMRDPDTTQAAILVNTIVEEFINQNKEKYQKIFNDKLSSLESQMQEKSAIIAQTEAQVSTLSSSIVQASTEISRQENLITGHQNDIRILEQSIESIQLEMVQAVDSISLVEAAYPSKKPVQNRPLMIILAGVVGVMLGVAIVFVLQYTNNKIRTYEDVNALLGLNVLGTIGRRSKNDPELLTSTQHHTPLAEQFSVLSARIHHALRSEPEHNILLVTSPTPSEGKSYVCANLAIAMANTGMRVVLIDADLRKPRIHQLFKVKESEGVAEVMQKTITEIEYASVDVADLQVLAGGINTHNPTQILNSAQLKQYFEALKQSTDLIILDCPPILPVADAQILAVYSNKIILVVRSGKTFIKSAQDAKAVMEQTGAKLLGVVLNDIPERSDHNAYYHYYSNNGKSKKGTFSSLYGIKTVDLIRESLRKRKLPDLKKP